MIFTFKSRAEAKKFVEEVKDLIIKNGCVTDRKVYEILGLPHDKVEPYYWDNKSQFAITSSYYANGCAVFASEPVKVPHGFDDKWNTDTKIQDSDDLINSPKSDNVNHPNHYKTKTGLETIQVIEAFTEGLKGIEATDTGNVIKYICRWKKKNGLEDLKKAQWYLNHLIDHVEKEN